MEWNYLSFLGILILIEVRNISSNVVQCPDNCSCRTGFNNALLVDCSRRDLRQIPLNITSSAESVDISENYLTCVKNDSFPSLTGWQELFLNKNEIRTIHAGAFQMMPNLTTLKLECNNLTEILGGYFLGLSNLQNLDISDNSVHTLSNDAFLGLTSLNLLKLGGNKLEFIPNGTFQNLPQLGYLHLQNNSLTVMQDGLFHGLGFLSHVVLSFNSISDIHPQAFLGSTRLSYLDLSHNNISSIPYLPSTKDLKSLNCDFNFISELTVTPLKYHKNLTTLSVNNNAIKILDYNIFEYLPELRDFSCNGNDLTWLDPRIGVYINRTESVDMTGNPWKCDYHLRWITYWNFSEEIFGNCSVPCKLSGKPLTALVLRDFFIAPRKMLESPSSLNFTSDEELYIVCPVFSFPAANISWFSLNRDGSNKTLIGAFYLQGVLGESLNGSLLFEKPNERLAGELWCLARNDVGEIALPITLNYVGLQSTEEGKRKGQSATAPSNLVSEEPKTNSTSCITYVVLSLGLLIAIVLGSFGIFYVHRKICTRRLGIAPSISEDITVPQEETSYGCQIKDSLYRL